MRLLLIVAESRSFAEDQSRERELPRDRIAIDRLFRDVQEDAVVVLVCVKVQRTVRHEEEVLGGQAEGVGGGGGDV